ncbi:hypothetical protein RJ640_023171 [Escallonia rubra]|uniref:Potassium transporter n=1 Tax=Escallonia rubra TaxID=112253 RepID=A0AA88RAE1_9ASTE|nr:hypothetical protein RJ640_023171 [Escallonia rubra]
MEDAKSINSMAGDDLENASTGGEDGGPNHQGEKFEPIGSISDRCFSFTRIYQPPQYKPKEYPPMETLMLAYQSLGVVYGDLGTSPTQVLSSITITNLTEDDYLGILSLIVWTLTLPALIKYVFIVLHSVTNDHASSKDWNRVQKYHLLHDHGEGGTFALYSNLCRHINFQGKLTDPTRRLESDATMTNYSRRSPLRSKTRNFIESSSTAQSLLTFIVLLGTCMVIGDGALTPATCVLSALQGIQSRSSKITQSKSCCLHGSGAVYNSLAVQRCGTSKVSFSFTPIMLLWYVTNVSIGVYNICKYHPSVLRAVSPHYIIKFFLRNGKAAWRLLGAVFLCISGAEALFADLGHFNKRAIQWAFSLVVYPAMILTYAGEVAYLIKNPDQIANAYYSSIPKPVYWPMFVISTLAAVVSSQSMISATFSIVKQSVALDCFPRVHIIHTSSKHEGQVYYTLMILGIGLVVGFKGGVELANAYDKQLSGLNTGYDSRSKGYKLYNPSNGKVVVVSRDVIFDEKSARECNTLQESYNTFHFLDVEEQHDEDMERVISPPSSPQVLTHEQDSPTSSESPPHRTRSLRNIYEEMEEVTQRIGDLTLFCLSDDSEPLSFEEAANENR